MTRFMRIRSRENQILGVNLDLIASISIEEQAQLKRKKPDGSVEEFVANVVRMYTAQGAEFAFAVGYELTQEEFEYICVVIGESLYKTKPELQAEKEAEYQQKKREFENDCKA